MRTKGPVPAAPLLDIEVCLLLAGWRNYEKLPGERVPYRWFGDSLTAGYPEAARGWVEYSTYLLRKAREWRWTPDFWVAPVNEYGVRLIRIEACPGSEGPYFWAEACAVAGRTVQRREQVCD